MRLAGRFRSPGVGHLEPDQYLGLNLSPRTLNALIHLLAQEKPQSVQIAALLDKEERREFVVPVAYRGFPIPDEFVVGYGLDFDENYRGLKDICVLSEGA